MRIGIVRKCVAACMAAASFAAAAAAPKVGDVVIETRDVRMADGAALHVELGTLYVPENRAKTASRTIGVGFARIRAARPTGAPPVFWLPGGPGYSVLGAFDDDAGALAGKRDAWRKLAEAADVVIVEQRGYTTRGEMLQIDTPALPLDRPETLQADAAAAVALAGAAVAAFPGKDLAGYSAIECADDVDAVRRALGYARISLYGGSFGSQWSLAVMRRHPQTVARAVLANVEPLDSGYDMPSAVFAAMRRIAFDADRDPGLAPWRPEGGLLAAIGAVLERLAARPVEVTIEDGGVRRTLVLGAGDFQQSLLARAYEAENWPAFVLGVYHGRYDDWARDALARRAAGRTAVIGPLIDTGLGATAAREYLLRTDPALPVIGAWGYAGYLAAATAWPTPDVGDNFRTPAPSAIPVVFVHGDWDTSTPIENALGLLPYFRNGHLIAIHRGLHDSAMYQLREQPALQRQIIAFLRTGEAGELPVSTSLPVPAFKRPDFAAPGR